MISAECSFIESAKGFFIEKKKVSCAGRPLIKTKTLWSRLGVFIRILVIKVKAK